MVDLSDVGALYQEKHLTMRQIATIKGCDPMTISRHLKKQGVSARHPNIDWSDLFELYVEKELSETEIAKIKGTQRRIVRKHLRLVGIAIRSKSQGQLVSWQNGNRVKRHYLKGKDSPLWKGERIISSQGYVLYWAPGHPYAYRGRVLEHRLVMEKHLGRHLMPWEVVHHKGAKYPKGSVENKQDNRYPENLQLLPSQSEHLPSIIVQRLINKLERQVVILQKQNELLRAC